MHCGVKYIFLVFQLHQLFGMDDSTIVEKHKKVGLVPFKTIFSKIMTDNSVKSPILMQAVLAVVKDQIACSSHIMAKKRVMSKKKYKKDITLLAKLISARRHNSAGSSFYEIFSRATDDELRTCFDPKKGWNALHFAAFAGNVSVCRKLIEKLHLNPTAQDKNGRIPKEIAEKNDRRNTVLYLKQYPTEHLK